MVDLREYENPGDEEWDPRNYRAVILPGFTQESLSSLPKHKSGVATSLLEEAVEFQDDGLFAHVRRYCAFDAADEGKNRELAGKIAMRDEQLKVVEAENVHRGGEV